MNGILIHGENGSGRGPGPCPAVGYATDRPLSTSVPGRGVDVMMDCCGLHGKLAATRPGIGTNNKVVLGTTESTCVAYVGPAAARTQRSVSYASDGEFFIAYGLPTAHSKTHVDCPREVRNLRKVIDNGGFLWVHESSRTSAPVGCRSSRRG